VKLSARNILAGTVIGLEQGHHSATVTVDLSGNQTITAVVTVSTVNRLGLAIGGPVWVIFKAPSVILKPILPGDCGGGMCGTVAAVDVLNDDIHVEVEVALPGGTQVIALVRNEVARSFSLAVGMRVRAMVPSSVVILGVDET
jgi:molybdate transport system regulatory protein